MPDPTVFKRVQTAFAQGLMLPLDDIGPATTLQELSMDSLDRENMETVLADEFAREIPIRVPRILEGVHSIRETVERIEELMALKIELPG